jgi:hypothetical protein
LRVGKVEGAWLGGTRVPGYNPIKRGDKADGRFTEREGRGVAAMGPHCDRRRHGTLPDSQGENTQHPLLEGYMDKQKRYKVIITVRTAISRCFPLSSTLWAAAVVDRRLEGALERGIGPSRPCLRGPGLVSPHRRAAYG